MDVLLDTHIVLWAVADTFKLPREVMELLESDANEVFYSVASVWEVAIKHKIHPEQMPVSEEAYTRFTASVLWRRLHYICISKNSH